MTGEKDTIFSSKINYTGLFVFRDFYRFCYDWLTEEWGLDIAEEQYIEKIQGTSKEIEFKWVGEKVVSDYFKFDVSIGFKIKGMQDVEVTQDKLKKKMNKAGVEIKISSSIIKDYQGNFETSVFKRFLRGIYEKWVISSRIGQYGDQLVEKSDEFLSQIKAYLDLEGKR